MTRICRFTQSVFTHWFNLHDVVKSRGEQLSNHIGFIIDVITVCGVSHLCNVFGQQIVDPQVLP